MRDILTAGEASLAAAGNERLVRCIRSELEQTMHPALVDAAEQLTGGRVRALMSATHLAPDLGVEVFVLDRSVPVPARRDGIVALTSRARRLPTSA